MRDLSPRQQRNVATDIKKGLKETLSHCTMNQSHDTNAIPPSLQTPLTPTARTMQSPDLNTSPPNLDLAKRPSERSEDGAKGLNASTIVSMATADGLLTDRNEANHALISRQSSHSVSGNRHFDTEVKRVPNSASYMSDKNAALFHFDEFQSDKLNCNSSNNCATKTSIEDVLSPHNNAVGTPAQDNAHMSRTPSTNSTLSPISLPMEETGENKTTNSSSRPQQSGILENQIRIGEDEFDETEIKDLTNLANNSSSDTLDPDIITGFDDEDSQNVCSTQESNFLFADSADSITGMVSQVTTAASTSPTVTTVTSSVPLTTRTSSLMVSDISSSPFNEKSSFSSSIPGSVASSSSPTTPFSPSSSGKKSYLQNILGVTDTMKLQSLSKPVNSGHIPCPTTTSFSSHALKSHSTHNQTTDSNSKTINLQQKSQMFHHANPQFMNRHGRNPNVTFQNQNAPALNQNAMKNQQQMRQNMTFSNNDLTSHNRPPFLSRADSHPYSPTTGGPNVWPQRGPSPSQTRSPPQFSGTMFNSKINPMTGLQCTVDSIPVSIGPGSTPPTPTVNNNNNMGPPLLSPSLQGGTPPPSRIKPPSLTSNGDKRCVSADGMIPSGAGNLSRAKERNKRERTKSADSKNEDDKKENSAPKSKRKKSRSKEDSGNKSIENKTSTRKQSMLNSLLDPKITDPSQIYVYSSQIANKAAEDSVANGNSIILYHRSFISNERLTLSPTHQIQSEDTPKSTPPQPSASNMTPVSGSPMTTSMPESQLSDIKIEPAVNFINGADDKNMPRSSHFSPKTSESNVLQNMALHRQSSQQMEEALSDEQRRLREEKLGKIQRLQNMFSNFPPNSENSNLQQWDGNSPQMRTAVRGPVPKEGQVNADQEWNNLLQEHNQEKVRQMQQHVHPPPPYQHGPHRWPNSEGFEVRMPMHPEMNNPTRFPRMSMSNRPRFPGEPMTRMPAGYQQRMSYRYMEPGPHPQRPMYENFNMPGANPSMPHPPNMIGPAPPRGQPQPRGPSSEIYPFSEKLARTAGLYNREPGFDPSTNEPGIGPHMGSPDWNPGPFNNNIPGPESTQRLSHLPGANSSPIHSQMAPNLMNPTSMESMILNQDQRPTGTPVTMEPMGHSGMRMAAPSPYDMAPQRMSFSNGDPMMNAMSSPTGPMRIPMQNHMSNSMNEAMARRGDQRPPDIPIPRSPINYVRSSLPSPNVMSTMGQRYSHPNDMPHGHMGMMHPQQSPLASSIPRSPGSAMMKSPMPQAQYGHMGPHSNSMDGNMMAPHSAGPMSAQPPDWGMSGAPTPGSRTPNMTSQASLARSTGQSALSVMMNSVNNYKMSSAPLYQEAVSIKDTPNSPIIHNPNEHPLSHEPPPLSHGVPPAGMLRNMGTRFPNFQDSPGINRMSPQAMHPRNMMPGMNIRNRSMPPGSMNSSINPNNINFPQHYQPETGGFDLKTILPRKDPSETISYFPPSAAAGGEMPAMEQMPTGTEPQINNHPQMSSMNNRFPNMNMCNRPLTPSNHPYGHPMSIDRSPNCYPPMDNNFQPGMRSEPQMMENFNQNPNWSEGIRPQMMHSGDLMYSANRP